MSFPPKIRKFINQQLDKGNYMIHGGDIVITLSKSEREDKYIYADGEEWRVLVPHTEDPDEKESLGQYPTKAEARQVRDTWMAKENARHNIRAAKMLNRVFNESRRQK